MGAEPLKVWIPVPFFSSQDLLYRCGHIVINTPYRRSTKKLKRTYMGIKYHLLSFIGVNIGKFFAAITKCKMGHFDLHHLIIDDHLIRTPVKLVRFPRGK